VRIRLLVPALSALVLLAGADESRRHAHGSAREVRRADEGADVRPETSDAADGAIGTLAQDEEDCADDPTLDTCALDTSEYTDTATAVDDAATPLAQLATQLGAISPPPAMAAGDYEASAGDCGVDLQTVAAAHKALEDGDLADEECPAT
jgi:hypothetical protein